MKYDPLNDPVKGQPYWLRPERDLEIEARQLKLMRDLEQLKKIERELNK